MGEKCRKPNAENHVRNWQLKSRYAISFAQLLWFTSDCPLTVDSSILSFIFPAHGMLSLLDWLLWIIVQYYNWLVLIEEIFGDPFFCSFFVSDIQNAFNCDLCFFLEYYTMYLMHAFFRFASLLLLLHSNIHISFETFNRYTSFPFFSLMSSHTYLIGVHSCSWINSRRITIIAEWFWCIYTTDDQYNRWSD